MVEFLDLGLCTQDMDNVRDEDRRQRGKWGEQKHSPEKWYTILGEEFGELGKAILEADMVSIREEALQAATVALKISHMADGHCTD